MNKYWFQQAYKQHHYTITRLFHYPPLMQKKWVQTAGAGYSKYIKYKGKTFELYTDENKDGYNISVLSTTEQDCILATVPKPNNETKVTIIQNINVDEGCAKEGLHKKGGTTLFNLMLDYLRQHKGKYNISRVVVSDASYLPCTMCNRSLQLARLRMITHSETWYMKFGFKPYDQGGNKRSDGYNKAIKYNLKIIPKLKTADINLKKIVHKALQEGAKFNTKEIIRLATKYKSLREFILRLLKQYDIHCCLVYWILEELYKPIKPILIDLYHQMFYLDL